MIVQELIDAANQATLEARVALADEISELVKADTCDAEHAKIIERLATAHSRMWLVSHPDRGTSLDQLREETEEEVAEAIKEEC